MRAVGPWLWVLVALAAMKVCTLAPLMAVDFGGSCLGHSCPVLSIILVVDACYISHINESQIQLVHTAQPHQQAIHAPVHMLQR